jgi:hypothetical protein
METLQRFGNTQMNIALINSHLLNRSNLQEVLAIVNAMAADGHFSGSSGYMLQDKLLKMRGM